MGLRTVSGAGAPELRKNHRDEAVPVFLERRRQWLLTAAQAGDVMRAGSAGD